MIFIILTMIDFFYDHWGARVAHRSHMNHKIMIYECCYREGVIRNYCSCKNYLVP